MHINRMFDEAPEHTNDDEQEQEHLIDEVRNTNRRSSIWNQPTTSTPALPCCLSHTCSDTNLIIHVPSLSQNEIPNNETIKPLNETRRTRSMFTSTKCSPS